jgi:hypothetical protein
MAKKKSKRYSKKGVGMPFEWIFAMIAGGAILFIAIYASSQFAGVGNKVVHTQVAAEIIALLDPYETGLASGKSAEINFPKESRISFSQCDESYNVFGRQKISFSQKFFDKYGDPGENVSINNKYVFANDEIEGKNFYLFSKPFFMGFKVADLIVISSDNYCFYQAPEDVKDEIGGLNLGNINFTENNCTGIKVCFDVQSIEQVKRLGCSIVVHPECEINCESPYDLGTVAKYNQKGMKTEEVSYMNNLIYGAIFSSDDLYECNVKRLMNKFNELGNIYMDKIKVIGIKGCGSDVELRLNNAMEIAKALKSSDELKALYGPVRDVEIVNQAAKEGCQLFESE